MLVSNDHFKALQGRKLSPQFDLVEAKLAALEAALNAITAKTVEVGLADLSAKIDQIPKNHAYDDSTIIARLARLDAGFMQLSNLLQNSRFDFQVNRTPDGRIDSVVATRQNS
jgi:hypothetical protein